VVAWDPGSRQYKKYTVLDGLATNSVGSIVLSSDNELWAGSWENGISRFDGEQWRQVESPGLDIVLAATTDGSIWASDGYEDLAGQYKDGSWRTFTTDDGLPSTEDILKAFAAPDGSLWVGTSWGAGQLGRYDGGSWRTYSTADGLPNDAVTILAISHDGTLWLSDESGISRFDGSRSTLVIPASDLQGMVIDAAIAPDGALWFATYDWGSRTGYGVQRVVDHMRTSFSVYDGLPSNRVTAIHIESDGTVWVGTDGGVAQYTGESWRAYTTDDQIAGGEIRSIDVAPDGAIWFTSLGGGVSRLDEAGWQTYTEQDGLADNLLWDGTIAADGTAWFGTWTSGMVSEFDGHVWNSYGTSDGLNTGGYVWTVAAAPDGSVWAGTDSGVAHFDGQVWQMYKPTDDGIVLDDVRSIVISRDETVWIGTYDYEQGGRVARLDDGSWRVYGQDDGLTEGEAVMVLSIASDGTVFAGAYAGLFKFSGSTWELVSESPGYVNDIAFASDGSMWIATEFDGVSRYDGSTWQENYRLGEGLPGFRMQSVAIAPDGAVWFGGSGGAARLTSSANP